MKAETKIGLIRKIINSIIFICIGITEIMKPDNKIVNIVGYIVVCFIVFITLFHISKLKGIKKMPLISSNCMWEHLIIFTGFWVLMMQLLVDGSIIILPIIVGGVGGIFILANLFVNLIQYKNKITTTEE